MRSYHPRNNPKTQIAAEECPFSYENNTADTIVLLVNNKMKT